MSISSLASAVSKTASSAIGIGSTVNSSLSTGSNTANSGVNAVNSGISGITSPLSNAVRNTPLSGVMSEATENVSNLTSAVPNFNNITSTVTNGIATATNVIGAVVGAPSTVASAFTDTVGSFQSSGQQLLNTFGVSGDNGIKADDIKAVNPTVKDEEVFSSSEKIPIEKSTTEGADKIGNQYTPENSTVRLADQQTVGSDGMVRDIAGSPVNQSTSLDLAADAVVNGTGIDKEDALKAIAENPEAFETQMDAAALAVELAHPMGLGSLTSEYADKIRSMKKTLLDEAMSRVRHLSGKTLIVRGSLTGVSTGDAAPGYDAVTVRDRSGTEDDVVNVEHLDSIATITVVSKTGEEVKPPSFKFLLQSVNEARQEAYQIFATFKSQIPFFYNERPRIYSYGGVLLDGKSDFHRWREEFEENYHNLYRGTRAVEDSNLIYLAYGRVVRSGYLINLKIQQTANENEYVRFGFDFLTSSAAIISPIPVTPDVPTFGEMFAKAKEVAKKALGAALTFLNPATYMSDDSPVEVNEVSPEEKSGAAEAAGGVTPADVLDDNPDMATSDYERAVANFIKKTGQAGDSIQDGASTIGDAKDEAQSEAGRLSQTATKVSGSVASKQISAIDGVHVAGSQPQSIGGSIIERMS